MLVCDSAPKRLAVQSQIGLEQQMMRQNQRDGTQPEFLQNIRLNLVPRRGKKSFKLLGTFCDFPISLMNTSEQKRPGRPGRSW
jgi:hypothetical protein